MSSDNGVFVLQTSGPEFRIAKTQSIDNIYSTFITESKTWTPDAKAIAATFGESKVYTALDEAWDAAYELEADEYSEFGVCLISEFQNYQYTDLMDKAK
jgi:hypothetical protein